MIISMYAFRNYPISVFDISNFHEVSTSTVSFILNCEDETHMDLVSIQLSLLFAPVNSIVFCYHVGFR